MAYRKPTFVRRDRSALTDFNPEESEWNIVDVMTPLISLTETHVLAHRFLVSKVSRKRWK